MAVKVDSSKCVGCGACPETCPVSALAMNGNVAKVDSGSCIDCGACVGSCPTSAISM